MIIRIPSAALLVALLLVLPAPSAGASEPVAPPGEEGMAELARFGIGPVPAAPPRAEGEGPFGRLVLRGGILIDGTGAPPVGPVDVVIEGGRITQVKSVGSPGVPIKPEGRPATGDRELDVSGMYLLPGFIDAHAHIANPRHATAGEPPPAEYVFKLWLAHGITTVRENASGNGLAWTLEHKKKSAAGEITAPHIVAHATFPAAAVGGPATPEEARRWVAAIQAAGADGIKFFGAPPEVMKAALAEAAERGLKTSCHHAQLAVTRMNVLDTSGWGLTSMEHWYGLPEALFADRAIQDYPADYNYNDEQHRFGQAGRLWAQAAPPGSPRWNQVMATLLERDFTLVPTLTIYEASRDLMRARRADWHDEYTWPSLWRWFQPSREAHGSYFFDWTTADEIAWKENFRVWMRFLDEYKDRGGRVAVGSDAGFIFKLFGFDYVRELELLQEAGFHPLEVLRAATLDGAELLGVDGEAGSVEPGKRADLVIVEENPLANFKVLYGTGALRLDPDGGEPTWVGGVRWTIKNGVIYDAKALLEDVRRMVAAQKAAEDGAEPDAMLSTNPRNREASSWNDPPSTSPP